MLCFMAYYYTQLNAYTRSKNAALLEHYSTKLFHISFISRKRSVIGKVLVFMIFTNITDKEPIVSERKQNNRQFR